MKPTLPSDAPVLVELFSAGGGVATAAVLAGIRPVISVEHNPQKPELSKAMINQHCNNFMEYGSTVLQQTVQTVDWGNIKALHPKVDFLHASPMCSNFSDANTDAEESETDLECASAVATAIDFLQPTVFTLEQVRNYKYSRSWEIIEQTLELLNYTIDVEIVNFSHYGLPQSRERLIVRAVKDGEDIPELPEKESSKGWFDAIKDLIPHMEDDQLLTAQQEANKQYRAEVDLSKSNIPVYIQRVGRGANRPIPGWCEIPTITRSIFTDQNDANRNKFANIVTGSPSYPVVKNVSIRAMARLQGFPDWYHFDENTSVAGSSIGYSVPPIPFSKILADLIPVTNKHVERHEFDFYQSPVWYTTELLKHQHIEGTVLEPCVGDGAIADILDLSPLVRDVFTNDIDPKRVTNSHLDATDRLNWATMPLTDWVITNPPYSDSAAPIIQNAFNHARVGVAAFVRLSFLEPCSDRADFLKKHPPTKILYLPRFCFRKDKNNKWSTDSATIVCLIWDKTAKAHQNVIIPESDIDLFYKNPDQQPTASEIVRVFENKICNRLTAYKAYDSIFTEVATLQATENNQLTENNRGIREMTLFADQISLLQQQINSMQQQLSAMQQFDDKSKDLKNLLTDCIETAKDLGVESQLQEEITKILWGDDFANKIAHVDAVASDPSVLESATSQTENTSSRQSQIPDGLSVREFNAVKKQVKKALNLSQKARNNVLKDSLLEKIANTNYDNESLLSEFQNIDTNNDRIWILAKNILEDMEQPAPQAAEPTPEPQQSTVEEVAPEPQSTTDETQPQAINVVDEKVSENNKNEIKHANVAEGYTPKISELGQQILKEAEEAVAAEKAAKEAEQTPEPQQQVETVETVVTEIPQPKQEPVKAVGFGKVQVQEQEQQTEVTPVVATQNDAKEKQLAELQSLVQTFG